MFSHCYEEKLDNGTNAQLLKWVGAHEGEAELENHGENYRESQVAELLKLK